MEKPDTQSSLSSLIGIELPENPTPEHMKQMVQPSNLKIFVRDCRDALKKVSCDMAKIQSQVSAYQKQNEDLRNEKEKLIKNKSELQDFITNKINETCFEASTRIKNEELQKENQKLKSLLIENETENVRLIDQEREKYELIIQEIQQSNDKLVAEQVNEINRMKASFEKERTALKDQLAEKNTLMDQMKRENESAKQEMEEKLVEERVQLEAEFQSQLAVLEYQLQEKTKQQNSAFHWGANKEQVSRKRLADMKSEHEKQIHALNNKIRELQSKKPRKCSCGGDIQNNTLSITTSSGSSKNYCLSKFSK